MHEQILNELIAQKDYFPVEKDILIVVKDQLEYLKKCIESIQKNTENYHLFIWDNGSQEETKKYIESLTAKVVRREENLGFIIPNNELIKLGNSPFVILVNSDVEVMPNWDKSLIGFIQRNPDVVIIGAEGARVDENFHGKYMTFGYDVDYVSGHCLCLTREFYEQYGLFDQENLEFAYGEDSDLCFRAKSVNKKIYVSHLNVAVHHKHKTIIEVSKTTNTGDSFEKNHQYLKKKWG